MLCPKCGAQVSDNAKFCLKCGSPLAAAAQAPANDSENTVFAAAPVNDSENTVFAAAPTAAPISDDSEKTVFAQAAPTPQPAQQQFVPPVQNPQPAQQFVPPVQNPQPAQQFVPPVQAAQPVQQFTPPTQTTSPLPEYPQQYTAAPAKSSSKRGVIILVVVLVLLVVGGVIALFATGIIGGNDPDKIMETAERFLDDKEYDKAIIEYEKLLDIDDENIDAYLGLAEVYMAQEKYSKAIKQYENALDIDDQCVDAYLGIADAYEADEKTDKAIDILEDGIEKLEKDKDKEKLEKRLDKLTGSSAPAGTGEAPDDDDNNESGTTGTTTAATTPPVVEENEPALFELKTVYGNWYAEEEYTDAGTYDTPIQVVIDSNGVSVSVIDVFDLYYYTYETVMTEDGFYIDDRNNGNYLLTFKYDSFYETLDLNFYSDDGIDSDFYLESGVLDLTYDEGDVLNIWCWNDEFQQRVRQFYPGYVDNGDGTGRIGDVTVKWTINPNADNGYQIPLDAALKDQDNRSADEKIDIFLIEADYADKYVNSDYSLPVANLGITDADTAEMYQYTKEIATDSSGALKAVSWQAAPGLFAYKRSIAKAVLGTDDPDTVQGYVADWDKFDRTAKMMKDNGYFMLSGYDDAYRVFSNNVSQPWVNDSNEIIIDDNLLRWVEQTKMYTDYGYNNRNSIWSEGWAADQGPDGKVFGFFYSTWGINFTLLGNAGNAGYGDWAVCYGPQTFYWGGTWLCAGYQTDNPTLVRDIMYNMTCNSDIMEQITRDPNVQDYTNNMAAMERIANDRSYRSNFLGGQNHVALFTENAKKIDMSNISPYDQGLNARFQGAFKEYFDGAVDFDTALNNFYNAAIVMYPALRKPY